MAKVEVNTQRIPTYICRSSLPILIVGPTGSGKEHAARRIRDEGGFGSRYRAVNCAAFNDELFLSEFLGHQRGAFTGADEHKLGLIHKALGIRDYQTKAARRPEYLQWLEEVTTNAGIEVLGDSSGYKFHHKVERDKEAKKRKEGSEVVGILFLDEVADLSPSGQAALLRLLDGYGFNPVGFSGRPLRPKLKIVAATSQIANFTNGKVRKDLFWRIAGWIHTITPLHERPQDGIAAATTRVINYWANDAPPQDTNAHSAEKPPMLLTDGAKDWLEKQIRGKVFSGEGLVEAGNFRALIHLVIRGCDIAVSEGSTEVTANHLLSAGECMKIFKTLIDTSTPNAAKVDSLTRCWSEAVARYQSLQALNLRGVQVSPGVAGPLCQHG